MRLLGKRISTVTALGALALPLTLSAATTGTASASNTTAAELRVAVSMEARATKHSPRGLKWTVIVGDLDGHGPRTAVRVVRKPPGGKAWRHVTTKNPGENGRFRVKTVHRKLGVFRYRVAAVNRHGRTLVSKRMRTHVHQFREVAPPTDLPAPPPPPPAPMSATATGTSFKMAAAGRMGRLDCGPSTSTAYPYTILHRPLTSGIWGGTYMSHVAIYFDHNMNAVGLSAVATAYVDVGGATYQWGYMNGNPAGGEIAYWNPGFGIAAANYTNIGSGWVFEGWSPSVYNVWCLT